MRLRHAAYAGSGLLLASLAVVWSGAQLEKPAPAFQVDANDIADVSQADTQSESEPGTEALPETRPSGSEEPSTKIGQTDPEDVEPTPPAVIEQPAFPANDQPNAAKPQVDELERLPARESLSKLAAPQEPTPPPTKMPDEWKSIRLFKPVASAAGMLEAQGYNIALAGIDPLPVEENCTFEGKEWPCGLRARTAFRSWLRGRAIACVVPPQPDRQAVVAECRVGKTDVSEWLVSNGWVKAKPDGAYASAGQEANTQRRGIFGKAPAEGGINLPRVADPAPMPFPETGSVVEEPEFVPQIVQPPVEGPFPPPPQ